MRYLADQSAQRIVLRARIGIQCNDEADPLRRLRTRGRDHEGRVRRNRGVCVQLMQLAVLPLPPDPLAFAGVPYAPAVEEH